MDNAFERPLVPPFDPYVNEINFLLASYVIPYIGVTGLTNANTLLETPTTKALLARILSMKSGQDGVIRTLLYEHRARLVDPYKESVEEFTNRVSQLRNKLGREGLKDEGLVNSTGTVEDSVSDRQRKSPWWLLSKGADGVLAKSFG
ncbi:desiccation-related protein PCC13-62-like [Arachis hypogaea]|uniref:desiccation-related protein PCC13-62-like n=1 Tax=Arachis hypogaea TaxID=3818 RepID=UPI003B210DF3